ncbi:hypothetical protein [uncultured Paraglaciecola sp.]|uniref:hypothetical protein n=1 Tax=uncultured Paraglaciecola sp. TaxID=1765024 RepID=UPI00261884ED|nr:hypothetical protein [uncultured Paraglaciecola sp.]
MTAGTLLLADDGRVVASVDIVSDYLGITPRRIQQLENSRGNLRLERGLYDLKGVVRAYCDQLGLMLSTSGGTKKDRDRIERAKAEMAELDLAERVGELVRADAVADQDSRMARELRDGLQTIPDRVAAILAAESDTSKCHRVLANEIMSSLVNVVEHLESIEVVVATENNEVDVKC